MLAASALCMAGAIFTPLFRTTSRSRGDVLRYTEYLWYSETAVQDGDYDWIETRSYTRQGDCPALRVAYVAAGALTVLSAVLSGLSVVVGASWVTAGHSVCLALWLFALTCLAAATATAATCVMTHVYTHDMCGGSDEFLVAYAPKSMGYHLTTGFVLMCVGANGLTVVGVVQAVGFYFGCQVGRQTGAAKATARRVLGEDSEEDLLNVPSTASSKFLVESEESSCLLNLETQDGHVEAFMQAKDL